MVELQLRKINETNNQAIQMVNAMIKQARKSGMNVHCFSIKHERTYFFQHTAGSLYVMTGCQMMTTHSKKQKGSTAHISIVLRNLKEIPVVHGSFTAVKVQWRNECAEWQPSTL